MSFAKFMALLDVIEASTRRTPVSESDYHDVVSCIRYYGLNDIGSKEKNEMLKRGWVPNYNPFIQPENIRYGMN